MFVRLEKSGPNAATCKRDGAAVRQRVIANLGRADELAPPARSPRSSPREPSSPTKYCSSQVLLTNALEGDAEGGCRLRRIESAGRCCSSESGRGWGSVRSSPIC
jgi:hypothetical protein